MVPVAKKLNTSDALEVLNSALKEKGFFLAGSAYADRYAKDLKGLSDRELFVYNRGINEDGSFSGKSNYFVMVLRTEGSLRVFMSNPDESNAATQFGFDKLIVRMKYTTGKNCDTFVENVVKTTLKYSSLKPELSYRYFVHNHLSEIGGEMLNVVDNMRDDGRASDRAFLLNLLLYHADTGIVTCHNNFPENGWGIFAEEALKYGIGTVPGFEATLPLTEKDQRLLPPYNDAPSTNGVHIGFLFNSRKLASSFWEKNFSNRADKYAPCASQGVELLKIYDLIDRVYAGMMVRLAFHPACDVELPDVGIVNRLAKGEISVDEMIAILLRSQGIGHFNVELSTTPLDFEKYKLDVANCNYFSDEEKTRRIANINGAQRYFTDLLIRHRLGSVFSPNNINIALAREFPAAGFMDTDGHDFGWFYTKIWKLLLHSHWPGPLAAGHNWIMFKEPPATRPDAKWMVEYLLGKHKDEVKEAKPKVYYVLDKKTGVSDVAPGRKKVPLPQKIFNLGRKLFYYTHRQAIVLATDEINYLMKKDKHAFEMHLARGSIPPNNGFHKKGEQNGVSSSAMPPESGAPT